MAATRRHVVSIVVAIAALLVAVTLGAYQVREPDVTAGKVVGRPRAQLLQLTNDARARVSAGQLQFSLVANRAAHQHSVLMSKKHRLFHSCCLTHDLRAVRWFTWGENVGVGTNVYGIFSAFMASPGHRENMLDTRFTNVGIGFVRKNHILWVTMIFYG